MTRQRDIFCLILSIPSLSASYRNSSFHLFLSPLLVSPIFSITCKESTLSDDGFLITAASFQNTDKVIETILICLCRQMPSPNTFQSSGSLVSQCSLFGQRCDRARKRESQTIPQNIPLYLRDTIALLFFAYSPLSPLATRLFFFIIYTNYDV